MKLLTLTEVCEQLKTNKKKMKMLRDTDLLKGIKIGKSYLYSQQEIDSFIEKYYGLDFGSKEKVLFIQKQTLSK